MELTPGRITAKGQAVVAQAAWARQLAEALAQEVPAEEAEVVEEAAAAAAVSYLCSHIKFLAIM